MDLIIISLISFLITALSVPLAILVAKRFDLVDDPSKRPHPAHIQMRVIPRAGGLPVYIGIVLTSLLFLPFDKHIGGVFAGLTLLLIVGLLDDKLQKFSPYIRLVLMFIAALAPVASGIGISFLANPLYHLGNLPQGANPYIRLDQIIIPFDFLGTHRIRLIADVVAFFWIVTLTQVINWSKGVDGQMPGITFVAALTLGILSLKLTLGGDPNQLQVAKLAFIVAGSSLGLLLFNWHPSKIIPGFSGSTILAFMIAVLSILSGAKIATAIVVLAVPTVDFAYTVIRRISQGKSPVWGDRGHFHHRLLDAGWSHQQISLFYILGSAILGGIALLVDSQSKFFIIIGVATLFCVGVLWLNSFNQRRGEKL